MSARRLVVIGSFFFFGAVFLFYQLVQLQLLNYGWMQQKVAAGSMEKIAAEEYQRGQILDRFGRSLTDEGERPALLLIPPLIADRDLTVRELHSILNIGEKFLKGFIDKGKTGFLATDLTPAQVSILSRKELPGTEILAYKTRYGPNSLAVHLVGHLKLVRQEGLGQKFQGAKGIELIYDQYLNNETSAAYWTAVKDASGKIVPGMDFNKESAGKQPENAVVLTIDAEKQTIVEKVMDRYIKKGAVVLLDVWTGEVLAAASRPAYDQNNLQQYQETAFLNRVVENYYPGSVFKLVVAAAALEQGLTSLDEKFYCSGEYQFPSGLVIPCWKEEGHGELTFREAMAVSCNPTFIEVGQRVGREKLINFAEKVGLTQDKLLGYPLPKFNSIEIDSYGPGPLANATLGQEGVKLSPIQVAAFYAAIANGGTYHVPSLVKEVGSSEGNILQEIGTSPGIRVISQNTAQELQQLLMGVTLYGTGQEAWLQRWGSAGKTSTAESGMLDVNGDKIDYAWFAGYAPLNKPRYAMAVMVEGGSSGGSTAAPIFKEIMQQLLQD